MNKWRYLVMMKAFVNLFFRTFRCNINKEIWPLRVAVTADVVMIRS